MTAIFFLSCTGAVGVYLIVTGLMELPAWRRERRAKKLMESDWRERWR